MELKIKRLHPDAVIPTRANPTDAGMDLYAVEDMEIPAIEGVAYKNPIAFRDDVECKLGQAKVSTGIAVEIPPGYYGKVSSRSGLAFKHGLYAFDGTVDASYRGEIGVLLYNTTDRPYTVKKGERVAQLIIIPCALPQPVEVSELGESDRGENGFGSSGK